MAYLKKEYRELLHRIDKELKLPKGWYYFVKKESEKQNFIIKAKGICTCNNCKTQFKSNKKINEIEKCPKCKNEYTIKSAKYSWHIFEKDLILVDKLDGKLIIRLFEIFSRYSKGEVYHSKPVEYGRIVVQNNLEFANNRMCCYMWGEKSINHTKDGKVWRLYNYQGYNRFNVKGKVFYKNLKELLNDTEFKYSELWTLAKKEDILDIMYYFKNNLPSTELLIKMQLYKLAFCPKNFNKNGNFEDRFGINKRYYKFMKENNIDIDELDILKLYKKEDIEGIKYLKKFSLYNLEKIIKYMSLEKLICYTKKRKGFDICLYLDYLRFVEELKLDLKNKKYLFPDNLKQMHDEYARQIEIRKNKKIQRKINKRHKELEKNCYRNKIYMIIPAKSILQLEDESTQQNHCVRTYAERYANGECDIYFMRTLKEPEKSLVTVEVKHNKITQSRVKNNKNANKVQKRFLEKWENEILSAA